MLTQAERNQLGVTLTELAVYYGKDFPKEQAVIFINALEKYAPAPLEAYLNALTKYAQKGSRFFPNPIQLVEVMNQRPSNNALADDSAAKIRQAISVFGWSDEKGAMDFLGSFGWELVKRLGGWQYICENVGTTKMPVLTFYAQSRDVARSMLEMKESGVTSVDQLLEYQNQKQIENRLQLGNVIKTITHKGEENGSK